MLTASDLFPDFIVSMSRSRIIILLSNYNFTIDPLTLLRKPHI